MEREGGGHRSLAAAPFPGPREGRSGASLTEALGARQNSRRADAATSCRSVDTSFFTVLALAQAWTWTPRPSSQSASLQMKSTAPD